MCRFSSFQYIKLFPIDFIKVEGDFIRNIIGSGNEVNKAIVNSIATFTAQVGIKTVAEYVEDEEILNVIELMGLDFAQGYHIGKPAPELKQI